MDERFDQVEGQIKDLRGEVRATAAINSNMLAFHRTIIQFGGALVISLLATLLGLLVTNL